MDRLQLVRDLWDARSRGDMGSLQAALAPDAKWRAVEDGPWNCENPGAIIDVIERQLAESRSGAIEDAFEAADRVVVAFRPDSHGEDAWPLDHGIRYIVLSFAGDRISELKGCADRAAALAYAQAP